MFRWLGSARRCVRRPLAAVLLVGVLAACGSGGTGAGPADGSGGEFHAQVTGKFGTTTIDRKPVRVVAMSWTDADLALSLGVTPVGIAKANDTPAGLEPWTETALGAAKPTLFDVIGGDPIEDVAKLAPDVILATKDYNLTRSYPQLSQIAPVVTYVDAVNSDSWQQGLANVATALGRAAEGRKVTDDTQAQLDRQRSAHPELAGKTFSYVIAPTAAGAFTVNSNQDVSAKLLAALGMRLSPTVLGLPSSGLAGRAQISPENLSVLDADVVLATGSPDALADLAKNPVFANLTSVRRGGYVPLGYTASVALAFPSPLSIQWALNQVLPKLAAAAKA